MTNEAQTDHEAALIDWPQRPWILAAVMGVAGLLVYNVTDNGDDTPLRMALAAALVFGPIAAAFTLDPRSWKPSVVFAAIVSLVMAGIAWRATSAGNRYPDEEFWVAAGVLAVTLSLPLFQAGFHRLRWKTSYKATHFHVWTDAITGGGALAFLGISWALLLLLSELFSVINIDVLKDLIDEEWFGWTFSGAALGAALGVLRNQLKIIGTLQNVVLLVLSILAVPLAIALVIFLLAVAASGLDVLWEATKSATPLLLSIAVGCFVLTNAVVRDEDEQASNSRILRIAGFVLAVGILPLAVMAAISMGTRIDQHGFSPERLWALIAIAVAVAYGVAYFVSAIRRWRTVLEGGWRAPLRQSNLHLAVLTCVVAFVLALPIFNFGAISASNQLARLEAGKVSVEEFDYTALRWDFGDAGREALAQLVESDNSEIAKLASAAQAQESRPYHWIDANKSIEHAMNAEVEVSDQAVEDAVREELKQPGYLCAEDCRVVEIGQLEAGPLMVFVSGSESGAHTFWVYEWESAKLEQYWITDGELVRLGSPALDREAEQASGDERSVELRPFVGNRLYVDGKPVSAPFK